MTFWKKLLGRSNPPKAEAPATESPRSRIAAFGQIGFVVDERGKVREAYPLWVSDEMVAQLRSDPNGAKTAIVMALHLLVAQKKIDPLPEEYFIGIKAGIDARAFDFMGNAMGGVGGSFLRIDNNAAARWAEEQA